MLAPLFHAWERRLASATKDRVVRPFDWGVDWIPSNGHHSNTTDAAGAADALEHWVEEVMRDSQAFFTAPRTSEFDFTDSPNALRSTGEAGTLRFPSALATPHPENNIVVARWFPSKDASSPGTKARGRAVVVLPQWNSNAGGHIGLSRMLARVGVSALRLSLPYHDWRMPPELARADYIVSSNIARTVRVCRQAVLDTRRAIQWLSDQGFERIGILGTSLGSCLSLLTSAHEPKIRAQALNHVSPWFADVVWRGLSTQHVREGLNGHIDLERDTRTLLVYAKYDLTFPVDLSRQLVSEFAQRGLPHQVTVLPCGHYTSGSAPFKFVDGYVLTKFLRSNL